MYLTSYLITSFADADNLSAFLAPWELRVPCNGLEVIMVCLERKQLACYGESVYIQRISTYPYSIREEGVDTNRPLES